MKFAAKLSAQVTALNPRLSAVFVPADDESEDPEIQLRVDGKETGVGLQIGAGYVCINRWVEAEQASYPLFDGETLEEAAEAMLQMIRDGKIP